jgi:hypothetical protein
MPPKSRNHVATTEDISDVKAEVKELKQDLGALQAVLLGLTSRLDQVLKNQSAAATNMAALATSPSVSPSGASLALCLLRQCSLSLAFHAAGTATVRTPKKRKAPEPAGPDNKKEVRGSIRS